ncbi:MAG TPA: hypothetical protein VKB35_05840 [Ktedonobacteraceae bacterium]|nr:hypothetical protein [Ktedonobacteraceae bacterium]
MKLPALEGAYEAARTWAVRPISHPPPGWAHIVRYGMASWMRHTLPEMEAPKLRPEPAHLEVSPLLTLVAAMIAEVCQ